MAVKTFTWTYELAERMLELRFSNDWLFQKSKQPWQQFHQLLWDNGFPKEMTVDHVRKKYGYMYDMYKIAKKSNKPLPYYEYFDKHYRKAKITDVKYESWSDEWRLKLITCVIEATIQNIHYKDLWMTVEKALRSLDLPIDCCIQDIQGLWHYINVIFNRKYRMTMKNGTQDWPLYDPLLEYYQQHDPDYLQRIKSFESVMSARGRRSSDKYFNKLDKMVNSGDNFQWNKHITEAFIQVRLQNDSLFKDRKWAWNDFCDILIKEHGFPKTLNGREICRKWACIYAEYQKAKATNHTNWIYYSLFEAYLGESTESNPTVNWREEWISNLISARIDLDYLFIARDQRINYWREVEKRLRTIGLPLDHSLLHLADIWNYLVKTFYWKNKFAKKGLLTEKWPYLEAMAQYDALKVKLQTDVEPKVKRKRFKVVQQKSDDFLYDDSHQGDDSEEDDMKLFDLKQKLGLVKPKLEVLETNSCRSCYSDEGCVNIFDQTDTEGFSLADKLRIIGDIQVDPSDGKPSQICFNCLRDLENAYKFRRKCQEADKMYKNNTEMKVELERENDGYKDDPMDLNDRDFDTHTDNDLQNEEYNHKPKQQKGKQKKLKTNEKKKYDKYNYKYFQMCDICGKVVRNLKSHKDAHASDKHYECDQCGKKFKFKGTLIVHRGVHDANRTPKKTCEVCGKTFHVVAKYKRHFAYHANERKFECETCGKRFNSIEILKVHVRIHTDERPFSCSECGKTFRTAGCVGRHKKIVHKPGKAQLI